MQVILRAMEPDDIDLLYAWENDHSLWQVSNTVAPFSRYILEKYIESSHNDIYQNKQLRLMIDIHESRKKGRTVGAIDLFDFEPFHLRAGVGVLIYGDENRNKGYASLALKELIYYAFRILHLHQVYCNIAAGNQISLKLFEQAGFKIAGIKKEWLKDRNGFSDEVMLQLLNTNSD